MGATTHWGDNDSSRVSHCIGWGGPRAPQREPLRRPRQSPEGYAPGSRRSRRPPPLPRRPWATSQCPAPPPAPASAAPQAEQPYPRAGPQAPWCPHDPHGAPRCPTVPYGLAWQLSRDRGTLHLRLAKDLRVSAWPSACRSCYGNALPSYPRRPRQLVVETRCHKPSPAAQIAFLTQAIYWGF